MTMTTIMTVTTDNDNVSPVGARGHTQAQASGGAPGWSCGDTHCWESGHNAPQAGQQHSPRPGGEHYQWSHFQEGVGHANYI